MAQVQIPATARTDGDEQEQTQQQMAQQQQQDQQQQQQQQQQDVRTDDSWACTPPDDPHPAEKLNGMDLDTAMLTLSPAPPKSSRPSYGFAMDDLEAAETLAGFARQSSPPAINTTSALPFPTYRPPTAQVQPEPLLSLLTSQHPLLGSAISGSLSAYNFGKSYSSQFRYGADFVERNIASPVATTVGTAGRITGVENGVRRWLSRGRPQQTGDDGLSGESSQSPDSTMMSPSSSTTSQKRRRDEMELDVEQGQPAQRSRAGSEISLSQQGEFLPAYDANRSPSYSSRDPYPPLSPQQHNLGNSTWQTRLILSTSGLGVAMSGESRRSLKYCLRWLRWGNGRLGRLVFSLQSLLAEYEAVVQHRNGVQNGNAAEGQHNQLQPRDQAAITAQLAAIRAECEKVLKKAVDVVSNYTGGALPDNARALVHRHLTSLPQRFAFALRGENEALVEEDEATIIPREALMINGASSSQQKAPESELNGTMLPTNGVDSEKSETEKRRDVIRAAKRMVVLAREGLEMMGQVSLVVDSTITSAEEWCNRLGRRIPEDEDAEMTAAIEGSTIADQTPDQPSERQAVAQQSQQLVQQTSSQEPHSPGKATSGVNNSEMEVDKHQS